MDKEIKVVVQPTPIPDENKQAAIYTIANIIQDGGYLERARQILKEKKATDKSVA